VGATVSVTGIGPAGNAGRAATAIVAPPALPARITGLTAHAQHRSVVIRWRSAARAARYRVTLRSGTGRRAKSDAFDVRKTSLKIHGLHAGARLRIKVQGESSAFGLGPSATTEVTAR
jgi:hypothetical protein